MESSIEIFRSFTMDRLALERPYLEKHILNTQKLIDNFGGQRRYLFFSEDSVESLKEQLNCWRLLIALYDADNEILTVTKLGGESDLLYRKLFHLCRWLEETYTESEFETLFAVSSVAFKKSSAACACDPDRVSRTLNQRAVSKEELDERSEMDRTMLLPVWQFLRKGNLLDAANYCGRIGQSWRAASLLGGAVYHKEKVPVEYQSELTGSIGCGRMWLKTCLNLSKKAETPVERAIYGWLCGNMDAILLMCQTREDRLWAYMHCQALSLRITALGLEQTHLYVDDNKLPTISEFLFSAPKRTKGTTEQSHYHDIKRHLIMGDHAEVLQLVHNVVTPLPFSSNDGHTPNEAGSQQMCVFNQQQTMERSVQVSSSFVQFTIHLLAYIIPYHLQTETSAFEDAGEDTTKRRLRDIVDSYVAACPETTSTIVYYTLCDREERIHRIVKTARSIGLEKRSDFMKGVEELYPSEYQDITMAMVLDILDSEVEATSKFTTPKDQEKIMSLDLLVESGLCSDYLTKVNALLYSFFEVEKFDAGSQLYDKTKQHILGSIQNVEGVNTMLEFHNWGDFITALRWYDTWMLYRKQCPEALKIQQPPTESNSEEDTMTTRWREQDAHNANQLRLAFEKVLLNDKWMTFRSYGGVVVESDTTRHFKFKKTLLSRYLDVARCYPGDLEFNTKDILKSVLADDVNNSMDMEMPIAGRSGDQPNRSMHEEEQVDIEEKRFCVDDEDEKQTLM